MAPRDDADQLWRSNNKKPMGRNARLTGTQNGREKYSHGIVHGKCLGTGNRFTGIWWRNLRAKLSRWGNVETPMQDYQSMCSGYNLRQSRTLVNLTHKGLSISRAISSASQAKTEWISQFRWPQSHFGTVPA